MKKQQEPTFNLKSVERPDFGLLAYTVGTYRDLLEDTATVTELFYLKAIERELRKAMNHVIKRTKYVDELDRLRRVGKKAEADSIGSIELGSETLGD